jgi:hypothetical protein
MLHENCDIAVCVRIFETKPLNLLIKTCQHILHTILKDVLSFFSYTSLLPCFYFSVIFCTLYIFYLLVLPLLIDSCS